MVRKEIKLAKETSDIGIKAYSYNVNVYTDNIPTPVVFVKGDVIIENDWCFGQENKYAKIEEKNRNTVKTNRIFRNGFYSSVFSVSKTIIISKNGSITVNGYPISDEETYYEDEMGSIDLVVPKEKGIVKLIEIENISGNISAKDLNIGNNTSPLSFNAKTISGSINLEKFQAMSTSLKTVSGSIKAEIYESFRNYETNLSSISGQIEKVIRETREPQLLLDDIYQLDAETVSGSIKVLFKGIN